MEGTDNRLEREMKAGIHLSLSHFPDLLFTVILVWIRDLYVLCLVFVDWTVFFDALSVRGSSCISEQGQTLARK